MNYHDFSLWTRLPWYLHSGSREYQPLPINKVNDFRFVLTACFEDARQSRARTISYRWAVSGTPEIRHGDIKAVSFKEKTHGNSSKSGSKTLVFPKLSLFYATFVVRTIILPPIVIRELQSSLTIKSVLMSVRRPMVGSSKPPGTGTGSQTSKSWKGWWVRLDNRLVLPLQLPRQANRLRTGRAKVRT